MTTTADGVDRLEPCEDWRPYIVAATPKSVTVLKGANRAEDGRHPRYRPLADSPRSR